MRSGIFALAVAGAMGLGLAASGTAEAGPLSPATAAAAFDVAPGAAAENVRWVCGPSRCVWNPRARGVVPPYARGWGPPRHSWCYWTRVRGPGGRWHWVQTCRR